MNEKLTSRKKIKIDTNLIELIKEEDCITKVLSRIQSDLNQFEHPSEKIKYLKGWVDTSQLIESVKPVILGLYDKQIRTLIDENKQASGNDGRLYSINDVADKLGCHRSTVYNKHMKEGLKSIDFGDRHQKVKASDLQEYIEMVQNRRRLSN